MVNESVYTKPEEKILVAPFEKLILESEDPENPFFKACNFLNHWLKVPQDKLTEIQLIINEIYYGSRLMDDIADSAGRHTNKSLNRLKYSLALTINTSIYFLTNALSRVCDLDNIEAVELFQKHILNYLEGQALETHWRENGICPTEEKYFEMVTLKTYSRFMLGVELMQLYSADKKTDFTELMKNYSIFYEIARDLRTIFPVREDEKNRLGEDFTRGKFVLPIVHGINSKPKDDHLSNIMREKTASLVVREYSINLLKEFGSLDYTRKYLEKIKDAALAQVSKLGGYESLEKFFSDGFARFETQGENDDDLDDDLDDL